LDKAVFLDRDGTLIREVGYLSRPDEIRVLPEACEAVRRINQAGLKAIVITNQSGLGRGFFDEAELGAIHARLSELFAAEDASLDAFFYCPHHPDSQHPAFSRVCDCRKPSPGLLERARDVLGVSLADSVIIGDKLVDVESGHRAGALGILVRTGYGEFSELQLKDKENQTEPDHVADNVLAGVKWFLERLNA